MSADIRYLSVLLLSDSSNIGKRLEQALLSLGHRPDCRTYETLADVESAIATRQWDLVVVEGSESLEATTTGLFTSTTMKLRLLFEDSRTVMIATGTCGKGAARGAEFLLRALSTFIRQAA